MLKEKEGSSAVAYTKLFLVIFLWGISPVVMKHILVDFSASIYSAISGFVAAITILIICKDKIKKLNKLLDENLETFRKNFLYSLLYSDFDYNKRNHFTLSMGCHF